MRMVITIAVAAALILLASSLVKGIVASSRTEATKSYHLHFGQNPDACPAQVAIVRETLLKFC